MEESIILLWSLKLKTKNQNFFPYLSKSSIGHLLLFLPLLVGGKILFTLGENDRKKNLELITASVRVDVVAMPKETLQELKKMTLENIKSDSELKERRGTDTDLQKVSDAKTEETKFKTEKSEVDTSEDIAFQKAQEKRMQFLNKLKTFGNKSIEENAPKLKGPTDKLGQSDSLKKLVLSGNKLSQGSRIYGEGGEVELKGFYAYASTLPEHVRPHWRLPSYLLDKKLNCRVRVWLKETGELTRVVIYESSGDVDYDQRAIEAVKNAAPFPPPQKDYLNRVTGGEMLLGFPL